MTKRPRNFYPIGMFRFMIDMSTDQKIAVDEVAYNVLRIGLSVLGFTCDHSNLGYSNSKPYCRSCYSRLEQVKERAYFKGKFINVDEFRPIVTFIDRECKELAQKAKDEDDARIKAGIDAGVKQFIETLGKNSDKKEDIPTV